MCVCALCVCAGDYVKLTLTTPMYRIAKALATPNSGLEVKDRVWLKMTIPKSFIGEYECVCVCVCVCVLNELLLYLKFISLSSGSGIVDWLFSNVEGFIDRRHARKYAALMLKHNFIRHTVNKITFSEQCYYIFGDFKMAASSLPSGMYKLYELMCVGTCIIVLYFDIVLQRLYVSS